MSKNKKKLRIKLVFVFILLGAIVFSSYYAFNLYVDSFLNTMNQEEELSEEEAYINEKEMVIEEEEKAHEVINFLLLGTDNDEWDLNSYESDRSDAIKIVSLDYTTKKIKLINLQRDVVVLMPDKDEYIHLNWAYWKGGAKSTIQTVNANLDMDITQYVAISYAGFINIIDKIGGIDVELTALEADAFNGKIAANSIMNIAVKEGVNHLDGFNALAYARQRYIDSDFKRVERQNTVIRKVAEKVKDLSYGEILDLVKAIMPYISTNINNEDIKSYMLEVIGFDLNDIQSYTWPNGEYEGIYSCPDLGGYLLKSYTDDVVNLHKYIWSIDDYKLSEKLAKIIDGIYDYYGKYDEQ